MDAGPYLISVARAMAACGLDAVLIGNAAAALQGAPVTTIDFDFFFRRTPANLKRLKQLAKSLDAVLLRPYYPASQLHRLSRDRDGLQVDFMGSIEGVRSFEGVRARSRVEQIGEGAVLRVASLADHNQEEDLWRRPLKKPARRKQTVEALRKESDLALRDLIRKRIAAPLAQRMNFLRKRIGICRSAL